MTLSFAVGDFRVDRILEQNLPFMDPLEFLPTLTRELLEENRHWLEPNALDPATGKLVFPMQSYLVRTGRQIILIDSCVGNHKHRPTRPNWHLKNDTAYMDALAKAGIGVGDVDFVMCTHLHPDHVGWNTRLDNGRWVPTFPNARYVFSKKELAHWEARHADTPIPYMTDSVLPVVEAGQVVQVASDHQFDAGIHLEPTPGHTVDHYAVHLSSNGNEAVMTGDMIHSPLQCRFPHLVALPDIDREQAVATRRAVMERYCETDTLICTAHFPQPSIGHFVRHGDAFDFRYADRG